jgi:hypothetical protein
MRHWNLLSDIFCILFYLTQKKQVGKKYKEENFFTSITEFQKGAFFFATVGWRVGL